MISPAQRDAFGSPLFLHFCEKNFIKNSVFDHTGYKAVTHKRNILVTTAGQDLPAGKRTDIF
jgi:hypothetical protein